MNTYSVKTRPSVFFSPAHDTFRSRVSGLATKLITPDVARQIDREDVYPKDLMKKFGEAGLIGTTFPKQYGGLGLDTLSWIIVMEEVARLSGSMGINLNIQGCVATKPLMFGTEEQKAKFLVPTLKGDMIGAFALTEPDHGSDAGKIESTARIDDNGFVLNGTKNFISNADVSDFLIFLAVSMVEGKRKISAFLVEKDRDGVWTKQEPMMGNKGTITSQVVLTNVKVPKENLIGSIGDGFKIMVDTLANGRITIAGSMAGLIRSCYEESIRYYNENDKSGIPLEQNQSYYPFVIKMMADYRSSLLNAADAAATKDLGLPFYDQAMFAKFVSSEAAINAASTAVTLQGLDGISMDSIVQRLLRDAKLATIAEGTSQILIKNLANNLLKE